VFDAVKAPDAKRDPVFEASAKCPAYVIPDEVAQAVRDKQEQDNAEFAKLVAKGTPMARLNTGIDGGMNKVFASKIPNASTGLSDGGEGQNLSLVAMTRAPGTIPPTVNPPHGPVTSPDEPLVASMTPATSAVATAPAASTRVASAAPTSTQSDEGFFSNLARKVGFGGSADTTATTQPVAPKPRMMEARKKPERSKPEIKQAAAARPALKPSVSDNRAPALAASAAAPAAKDSVVAGSAPIVQTNSFDSRFQSFK
jgi:hypothetical protein